MRQSVLTPLEKLNDDDIKKFFGFEVSANQCTRIRQIQTKHIDHEKAGITTFSNDGGKSSLFGFTLASRAPNCSLKDYRKRWELFPTLKDPVAPIYEVYRSCGISVASRGKQPTEKGQKKSLTNDHYRFDSSKFDAPDFPPKFRLQKQGRTSKGIRAPKNASSNVQRESKRDRNRNVKNKAHGIHRIKTPTFKANNSRKQLSCEPGKESKSRQLRAATQNASAALATPPTLQMTTTAAPVSPEVSYSACGPCPAHVDAAELQLKLNETIEKLRVVTAERDLVTAERDLITAERDQEKMEKDAEKDALKTENDQLRQQLAELAESQAESFLSQSSV